MRLGVLLAPLDHHAPSTRLADQAKALEAMGFASLWSAQAMGRGFMMTDPLIALATAAAVTETLTLGTAVLQLPLYTPMELAHRVFSLQQVCGDRLILGLGAGSTAADFAIAEKDYAQRFTNFQAQAVTLKRILKTGSDGARDHKPWQAVLGGPPIYLGSWGAGVRSAAQDFDGWIASAHYRSFQQIADAQTTYQAQGGKRSIVSTLQLDENTDLGALKAKLHAFRDCGFAEAVVMFLPGGPKPEHVIKLLD
ncbi:MAG: LLM class flavin-dependent oxidoreductase [Pseudomonadales bacterium]|nr:LLM class flavin-dependent oxidoreductase [Pseudomonadales bacterium]